MNIDPGHRSLTPRGAWELMGDRLESVLGNGSPQEETLLRTWLASGSSTGRLMDDLLGDQIARQFECLQQLGEIQTDDRGSKGDRRLIAWCDFAAQLSNRWQNREGSTWLELFSDLDESAASLADAMLCEALRVTAEQASPRPSLEQREFFQRLTAASQTCCRDWPTPPTQGRIADAERYIQRSRQPEFLRPAAELRPVLAACDDLFLADLAEYQEATKNVASSTAASGLNVGTIAVVRTALATPLREFLDGWPVEFLRLLQSARDLREALPNSTAQFGDFHQTLDSLRELLDQFTDALLESRREPPDVRPPAQVVASEAHRTSGHPVSHAIGELTDWVRSTSAAELVPFQDSLDRADSLLADGTHTVDLPAIGRELTGILFEIDAVLVDPQRRSSALIALRDRLRRIVLQFFSYVIVDQEILGQPLHRLRDQARIHRVFPSSTVPRDHVVSVHRPGYFLRLTDGSLTVIRLAEVNVAR